ncbi:MAG: hypothetical protein COA84_01765 [Robiginitomaculum sp.]|nr:MAG: hypothetical protein COA84_01765 [Robiginitomaculum sp.]
MITQKNINTGLFRRLSQLMMLVVVSAWMLAVQACMLHDEAGETGFVQVAQTHVSGDAVSNHQDHEFCEASLRSRTNTGHQFVAVAGQSIKIKVTQTNSSNPGFMIAAQQFDVSFNRPETIRACVDTNSCRSGRSFVSFWSHAPPTDIA